MLIEVQNKEIRDRNLLKNQIKNQNKPKVIDQPKKGKRLNIKDARKRSKSPNQFNQAQKENMYKDHNHQRSKDMPLKIEGKRKKD